MEHSFQFGHSGREHLAQALSIYPHGIEQRFMVRAASRDGLRSAYTTPGCKSRLKCGKHWADCFSECRDQVGRAQLDVIFLSQERLADTLSSCNRSQGEAELDAMPARCIIPDVLQKKFTTEPAGESQLVRVSVTDSESVEGPNHGIEQIRDQQSFKLMPAISGGHQIEAVVTNRAQEF